MIKDSLITFSKLNEYHNFLDLHLKANLTIFFMNLSSSHNFHQCYKHTAPYNILFNTPHDQPPEDHPCYGEDQGIRKPDEFFCISYPFHVYLREKNYLTTFFMGTYVWGFEKGIDNRSPEMIVDEFYNHKVNPTIRKPLWDG